MRAFAPEENATSRLTYGSQTAGEGGGDDWEVIGLRVAANVTGWEHTQGSPDR